MLARGFHIWFCSSLMPALLAGLVLSGTSALANPPTATVDDTPGLAHGHRKASVGKAWVVADPALPEETLLAKLAVGEVVRVLHGGRSWDRVEVIDAGRTTGWVLKKLFEPATPEQANQAIATRRRIGQRARNDTARRALERALRDEAKARTATARELNAQEDVHDLVREAEKRVADAHSTWRRVTVQVQEARNLVGSLQAPEPGIKVPMAPAPTAPLLVRPSEPVAQIPNSVTAPSIQDTASVSAAALHEPPEETSPVVPRVPPPDRVTAAAPEAPRDSRPEDQYPESTATPKTPVASTGESRSPQPQIPSDPPVASADSPRHPSTPESSSASPPKVAGVSPVTHPPAAIIGHHPATTRPVTVGAGGVTLGGALIALVMLAGLGGFGGWWRRRHGDQDSSTATRLRSLATVPVGKEASVALIGAPGRTLMVGCSSAGVHLVSEMPGSLDSATSAASRASHPSLRQLFPDVDPRPSSRRNLETTAPVSQEIQRLAAASRRALGGLT